MQSSSQASVLDVWVPLPVTIIAYIVFFGLSISAFAFATFARRNNKLRDAHHVIFGHTFEFDFRYTTLIAVGFCMFFEGLDAIRYYIHRVDAVFSLAVYYMVFLCIFAVLVCLICSWLQYYKNTFVDPSKRQAMLNLACCMFIGAIVIALGFFIVHLCIGENEKLRLARLITTIGLLLLFIVGTIVLEIVVFKLPKHSYIHDLVMMLESDTHMSVAGSLNIGILLVGLLMIIETATAIAWDFTGIPHGWKTVVVVIEMLFEALVGVLVPLIVRSSMNIEKAAEEREIVEEQEERPLLSINTDEALV